VNLRDYRTLLAAGAALMYSGDIANYTLRYGLAPPLWVSGFLAASTPLALAAIRWGRFRLEPMVIWAYGYLAISFLWFFPSSQSAVAWQQVQTRVLSVIFLLLLFFLFVDQRAQRAARQAIAVATLISSALNLYELFNPMTFSDIPGRSTGLFANVNQSGAAIVLGLILGQGVVPPRYRGVYVIATGVGLMPTFSRSAILGWVAVCFVTWLLSGIRPSGLLKFGTVSIVAALFLLTPWWGSLQTELARRGVLTENVLDRLAFFEGGGAEDASAEERVVVAQLAWQTFADHPVTGTGTGATTENDFVVGPHNIYLAMMAEHGISGLFIVPALLLATLWGANRDTAAVTIPFALFIIFWGFFSHNVLEERYILLSFALVAAMVASRRQPVPQLRQVLA